MMQRAFLKLDILLPRVRPPGTLSVMSWTKDSQGRLDHLRSKELTGTLTESESTELVALMTEVEAEEAQALAPAMNRMRAEIGELSRELGSVQGENEELARLLAQQQALAADARHFLAEFDQRRSTILDALARFARGPLPTT
jgi:septal ring factor EnvC (AmiA/AmiB activator)